MFKINYNYEGTPKTCLGVESWAEMTVQQFLPAVRAIYLTSKSKPEARYQIPLLCSNIQKQDYLRFNQLQAAQLVAAFDFLLEYKDLPSKWLVPKLEISKYKPNTKYNILPKTTLHGPADKLKNLVFEEFIFAESMFDAYQKKQEQTYLDQFIAILYRPKGRDKNLTGDIREPFNKHSVDNRALSIAHIPPADKQAILLNYIGCKALLPKLYKDLFSETDPLSDQQKQSFSWLDVAYRLSEHRPTELQTLKGQNLHEVLASLNLKVRDNKALKAEMEDMRRKNSRK
jgi:hypothetical protein